MKVNFVVPTTEVYGGIRVVFELANHLKSRGHQVRIIVPVVPVLVEHTPRHLLRAAVNTVCRYRSISEIGWFDLKAEVVTVPHLSLSRFVPDADICVATWWKTAYHVADYPDSKGEGHYFIQHYETHAGPTERVEQSYKLSLNRIVTSSWLREEIESLGVDVAGQVLYGVDFDQFYPKSDAREVEPPIRVGMMYSDRRWKGCYEGIAAFDRVARDYDVELVMFGRKQPDRLPVGTEFHKDPDEEELRAIYSSMDVFMMPSLHEGFGMPPMEAMACGTACLVTDVGGVPDYTIPGETAVVVPPEDIDALTEELKQLVANPQAITDLANSGYEYIQKFTWEWAADQFESVLNDS